MCAKWHFKSCCICFDKLMDCVTACLKFFGRTEHLLDAHYNRSNNSRERPHLCACVYEEQKVNTLAAELGAIIYLQHSKTCNLILTKPDIITRANRAESRQRQQRSCPEGGRRGGRAVADVEGAGVETVQHKVGNIISSNFRFPFSGPSGSGNLP